MNWVSDPLAHYVLLGVICFTKKVCLHNVMCILYHKKSTCYLIF